MAQFYRSFADLGLKRLCLFNILLLILFSTSAIHIAPSQHYSILFLLLSCLECYFFHR
uniref:Uncharacterized protein n=1 Tax=Utricularia reniformis TaxID=192314 RepID=A0A1Y0AZL2_9LAMI|nr:hypothetical protein AEK19_MT0292 [Utricularia reniformis]ART30568.1 hypothetical protein AEK19_MT0292 [Utricularia reniformis]